MGKTATRALTGVFTGGLSEVVTGTTKLFSPKAPDPVKQVSITEDDENKAEAAESEAEARRRRRGVLKRVFTQPGQNFVQQTNIGRNSILGV